MTDHQGVGQVTLPMTTPAVMAEGGVHLKYFFGGAHEEVPVADYVEKVPDSVKDATIKGMKMKIGIAVSQDGKTWGRVEGDYPCGACLVPYDPNDPNQDKLNIDEELYAGWPEVVGKRSASSLNLFLALASSLQYKTIYITNYMCTISTIHHLMYLPKIAMSCSGSQ